MTITGGPHINSLAFGVNYSDKSLLQMTNSNKPSRELWEKPVLSSAQVESCSFNIVSCLTVFKFYQMLLEGKKDA